MASWYDDDTWGSADDYFGDFDTPDVNELLFGNESVVDHHAQELFTEAFFNNNDAAYMDLVDYMWEEYHMDFEDAFDWEDFRDWYEAQ